MIEGYIKKKDLAPIKVYKETHQKLLQKSLALSVVECRRVSIPETLRRTLNIPNIDLVLMSDADIKRRQRR